MQQARTRSLTMMVTRLPCNVHKLVSLKTSTMKYFTASWRASTAVLCIFRSLLPNFSATSHTRRWKGAFLMRRSVVFRNLQISLAATVPGHQRWGFLTAITFCPANHAAFVAKWKRGGTPPVDLRAICLTRAMVGDVYGRGCSLMDSWHPRSLTTHGDRGMRRRVRA